MGSERPAIPEKVRRMLWVAAGGRCEFCNASLWRDAFTKMSLNRADAAHIYPVNKHWPRYEENKSSSLVIDQSNLMLLCQDHHRLVDQEHPEDYPAERLLEMKRKHEERIELLTSITEDKMSHIILYSANIGAHNTVVNWAMAAEAMAADRRCPAEARAVELGVKNEVFPDHQTWLTERERLRRQFNDRVRPLIASGEASHLSFFGLAPQPLLMELGRLSGDIPAAEVYQLHREPPDWKWQEHPLGDFDYTVSRPESRHKTVVLNLSLSAAINNSRIEDAMKGDYSVWTMTVPQPGMDFLKSREQLSLFRIRFRKALDDIKDKHGEDAVIHVFPAVPVAIAIDVGRVWMPKAHLPMQIYDQNRKTGGFTLTFGIGAEAGDAQ